MGQREGLAGGARAGWHAFTGGLQCGDGARIHIAYAVAGGAGVTSRGDGEGLRPDFEGLANRARLVFAKRVAGQLGGLRDVGAVHERAAVVAHGAGGLALDELGGTHPHSGWVR